MLPVGISTGLLCYGIAQNELVAVTEPCPVVAVASAKYSHDIRGRRWFRRSFAPLSHQHDQQDHAAEPINPARQSFIRFARHLAPHIFTCSFLTQSATRKSLKFASGTHLPWVFSSTRRGVEQVPKSSGKSDVPSEGGAKCGALSGDSGELPADLLLVIDAWETLPEAIKAGILAMVRVQAD